MTTLYMPPALGPDGTLYFADSVAVFPEPNFDSLYAVKPDGTLKWQWRFYSISWAQPVVDKAGRIYFCEQLPSCFGIDPDGHTLWQLNFLPDSVGPVGVLTAPLITSDGTLLILDSRSNLYIFVEPKSVTYLPMIL